MHRPVDPVGPLISAARSAPSYTIRIAENLEGDYGKSRECAPATASGAGKSPVACGKVGSSDFSHCFIKRFGDVPDDKPSKTNHIGSFAAENGASPKSSLDESSQGSTAHSEIGENDWSDSCEAQHVSISPQENRCGTASALGKGKSGKEGCLAPRAVRPQITVERGVSSARRPS